MRNRLTRLFAVLVAVVPLSVVGLVTAAIPAAASCQPTTFTQINNKDVYFNNNSHHAIFNVYYGRCVVNSTEYIQFATETSVDFSAPEPQSIAADQFLYLCAPTCTKVFSGQAYSNAGNVSDLYEDSPVLLDTFAGQRWCIYTTYSTGYSFIHSIQYNPTTVSSGSWQTCGTY